MWHVSSEACFTEACLLAACFTECVRASSRRASSGRASSRASSSCRASLWSGTSWRASSGVLHCGMFHRRRASRRRATGGVLHGGVFHQVPPFLGDDVRWVIMSEVALPRPSSGPYCLAGVALQSPVAVTPARRGADTTGCVGPSGNRCGCNARLRLPARAQSCSILILCFGTRHQ